MENPFREVAIHLELFHPSKTRVPDQKNHHECDHALHLGAPSKTFCVVRKCVLATFPRTSDSSIVCIDFVNREKSLCGRFFSGRAKLFRAGTAGTHLTESTEAIDSGRVP